MSTRMFGKVSYIREVLQCCRARNLHNHRDPLAFASGSEAEVSLS